MKRIQKIKFIYEAKYELIQVYRGVGIYQEICGSGIHVSDSWLLVHDPADVDSDWHFDPIRIQPYNHLCQAEILDMIDAFLDDGDPLGLRGFHEDASGQMIFNTHAQGKERI